MMVLHVNITTTSTKLNNSAKIQLLGQLAFPINLISLGLNLILEKILYSIEAL